MKKVILLIAVFVFVEIIAQTRPANIEIPITIWDNSGMPNNPRILICGIDSMATDSIDSFLGEYWLFCPSVIESSNSDCPPIDHFEALFDIPSDPPPGTFLYGTWKDFRFGMIPYSGNKIYTIQYVNYSTATAMYISWDFPEGVTGVLQDFLGGVIINYQMPDSGTYTHPALIQLGAIILILTYQNAIPVELLSLNAILLDNNVKLNWTTATETNNSGFEILRFAQNDSGWESIGFIPGFGTTSEPKSYSFIDEDILSGIYKYRLKQIDFDGSFEYSNEIEVEVNFTPEEFVLYQNYPNPFNPSTTIKFTVPNVETHRDASLQMVLLKVFDILGNEVVTLINEEKQPGVYEFEFDASSLSSGMYLYKLQAGTFVQTRKMILTK